MNRAAVAVLVAIAACGRQLPPPDLDRGFRRAPVSGLLPECVSESPSTHVIPPLGLLAYVMVATIG